MSINFKTIWYGLKIKAKSVLTSTTQGDIEVDNGTGKIHYHDGTVRSPLVTEVSSAVLENKTIDADLNTITNIENDDIKALAAIDASKIADGSVSNAEFEQLKDLESAAVGITDIQVLTNKTIDADANTISNIENEDIKAGANIEVSKLQGLDPSKAVISDISGILTTSTTTNTEIGYVSGVTSSIQTQLNNKINSSEKGANNGVATLDAGGKVPAAQLPSSVMTYEGTYDASTNTPTLANGTGDAGQVYLVNVAGTVDFGAGAITFGIGDWVVYSGSIWQKSSNSNAVVSVNGYTGVVSLTKTDLALGNVDNTSDATKNAAAVTLTNKSLSDSTTAIVDSVDNSKQLKFDVNGTTGTSTTIATAPTADRTVALVDGNRTYCR